MNGRCILLLLLTVSGALAEPPRRPEVFGSVGGIYAGGDEGSPGNGVAIGGAATLPLSERWAVDTQALGSQVADQPNFKLSRYLLSPGLQYRRGDADAYWFVAFGAGVQYDRSRGMVLVYPPSGPPSPMDFHSTDRGWTLHWRSGVVTRPIGRMLIRGEFLWIQRHVLPSLGGAVSLGYRF